MSTRQDYLTAIGNLAKGEYPLGETEKIMAIEQALELHSKHRPRIVVADIEGAAVFDYAITLLTSWSDGFSVIKQVEYPVDDTNETPDILQDDDWMIYEKPEGQYLRFLNATPLATEDIRVTHTAPHTCTDAACTVKTSDEKAVQALSAAFFCEMLSTYFAQTQDSTIMADSVDHKNKSRDYSARAAAYRKIYYNHLGIKEGETPPASVTRDQDLSGSWAGDKLTHPRKYR